jgi:CDP-glucose 4,6-dehydratase
VRQPGATRPFQHVLDVLAGYLLLAERLVTQPLAAPQAVNFGPADAALRVRDLLSLWQDVSVAPLAWTAEPAASLPERHHLALDSSLASHALGWQPACDGRASVAATALWYTCWLSGEPMAAFSEACVEHALTPAESRP